MCRESGDEKRPPGSALRRNMGKEPLGPWAQCRREGGPAALAALRSRVPGLCSRPPDSRPVCAWASVSRHLCDVPAPVSLLHCSLVSKCNESFGPLSPPGTWAACGLAAPAAWDPPHLPWHHICGACVFWPLFWSHWGLLSPLPPLKGDISSPHCSLFHIFFLDKLLVFLHTSTYNSSSIYWTFAVCQVHSLTYVLEVYKE